MQHEQRWETVVAEPMQNESNWQAVVERNPAADGEVYYAVVSTKVYCRPTCPSRRPRRENVRFFPTPDAAEEAGFRPCQRCRPQELSTEQRVVAQVQRLLQEAEESVTLAELGAAAGISPYHLQRLFKRAMGLSPREYAANLRAERLKAELTRGGRVTDALYDAGYGSSRGLYTSASRHLGMSPGVYQKGGAGERVAYGFATTPLGLAMVAATQKGVCALRFGESEAALLAELTGEFPRAEIASDLSVVQPYLDQVQAHLAGQQSRLDLPLDLKATAFQQRVWATLQAIPYGQIRSYQQVAEAIGEPKAVRAVARACATNPVALAVPCHRVVRSSGELSGYRWGVERKQRLLELEGAQS